MQFLLASLLALMFFPAPMGAAPSGAMGAAPSAAKELAPSDAKTLTLNFGVYQSEKATVMYRKLSPVLDFLGDDLDHRLNRPVDVKLTIFKSYEEGVDALLRGEIDFVRFGPASYVMAKSKQGNVELLVMEEEDGCKRFKGAIIVQKSSPIQTLAELKGKRFAFGDQNSTIGRYLAQAELVKAGVHQGDLAEFKYLGRHDTVASAVELGDFEAGSVRMNAFEAANKKGNLRVIATFDNVTSPWVARAGMERPVFEALQQSLYSLKDPAILKELKISGFAPTSDEEYSFVREGMKKAEEFASKSGGTGKPGAAAKSSSAH